MNWELYFEEFLAVEREYGSERDAQYWKLVDALCIKVAALLANAAPDDISWFVEAMGYSRKGEFAIQVLEHTSGLPVQFFDPLLRAAVYEIDPSLNRYFIAPCIKSFGARVVYEALLRYVETGTNFEKAGAINGLYWATVLPQGAAASNAEAQAVFASMADLRARLSNLLLKEFVSNENVDVRRSIIAMLSPNPAAYATDVQALLPAAIAIAYNHPDKYIRDRAKVQFGNSKLYPALPHRKPSS